MTTIAGIAYSATKINNRRAVSSYRFRGNDSVDNSTRSASSVGTREMGSGRLACPCPDLNRVTGVTGGFVKWIGLSFDRVIGLLPPDGIHGRASLALHS